MLNLLGIFVFVWFVVWQIGLTNHIHEQNVEATALLDKWADNCKWKPECAVLESQTRTYTGNY